MKVPNAQGPHSVDSNAVPRRVAFLCLCRRPGADICVVGWTSNLTSSSFEYFRRRCRALTILCPLGGEIRDEGAVGRGSSPKMALCGFWVSDLLIPSKNGRQPWESDIGKPAHYASSFDIIVEAPIGSARYNNEFGRPSLAGAFRTLLTNTSPPNRTAEWKGYVKPM